MAPLKGEITKLRDQYQTTIDRLRALDVANDAVIAELRRDLEGMTWDRDKAVRRAWALDVAARDYLLACDVGPNSGHEDRDLTALADAVFG
jgi:hypothetical protein